MRYVGIKALTPTCECLWVTASGRQNEFLFRELQSQRAERTGGLRKAGGTGEIRPASPTPSYKKESAPDMGPLLLCWSRLYAGRPVNSSNFMRTQDDGPLST